LYTLYTTYANYTLYMPNEETTIRIKKNNKKRMAEIGKKDNSYDDILDLLLEYYESNHKKKK